MSCAKAIIGESIANKGKVAPHAENPTTAHNEQTLMDIRSDGISPNTNTPNPCAAVTVSKAISNILEIPPGWGKFKCP